MTCSECTIGRNYLEMSVMRQADRLFSKEKVSEEDFI